MTPYGRPKEIGPYMKNMAQMQLNKRSLGSSGTQIWALENISNLAC